MRVVGWGKEKGEREGREGGERGREEREGKGGEREEREGGGERLERGKEGWERGRGEGREWEGTSQLTGCTSDGFVCTCGVINTQYSTPSHSEHPDMAPYHS